MKKLILIRDYKPEASLGRLLDREGSKELSETLERPNLKNRKDDPLTIENESSCIPEGIYKVVADNIGKFKYFRVLNVPNRANIEIHPANTVDELLGCIAFGKAIINNIDYKGKKHKYFITESVRTCDELRKILPKEFELEITSNDSLCKALDEIA